MSGRLWSFRADGHAPDRMLRILRKMFVEMLRTREEALPYRTGSGLQGFHETCQHYIRFLMHY